MRVHLLALPNVQTTDAYDLDGFCTLTIRMAKLLKRLGHTVILYASEENEAPCDELVTVVTKAEQARAFTGGKYQHAVIEQHNPLWQMVNPRISAEIGKRKQPQDIVCSLGGGSQWPATADHPELMVVEYSIGYVGNFSPYRVFESAVWQHHCYGFQKINEVRNFDAVIPVWFDVDRFPEREPEDYVVYLGRYIPMKGVTVACEAAKLAGVPLKLIGHGDPAIASKVITYGEDLGSLPTDQRNEVLARARALICPTQYIEPFGCISPEAQLCGTPVISTDMGGFLETVEHGYTGFRCNLLGEFVDAIKKAGTLDRKYIRERARAIYGEDRAAALYKAYFDRLSTLWDKGWDTVPYEVQ